MNEEQKVAYTTTYRPCKMANGFQHVVRFWIFKRQFMACEDCGQKHYDSGWVLLERDLDRNKPARTA